MSYVGIGNGAGWATTWEDRPANLLGLENIAELGWETPGAIRKVIARELGHLFMMSLRSDYNALVEEPLLALYEEGFAQHCEHITLRSESWGCASQPGWSQWCHENPTKYLKALGDTQQWRTFLGSWFEVEGWRQTGYFLGCRLVQRLSRQMPLIEVGKLSTAAIKAVAHKYLASVALGDEHSNP